MRLPDPISLLICSLLILAIVFALYASWSGQRIILGLY